MNIFNMKLHEKNMIDKNIGVLCVPGGWIYTFLKIGSSIFVPYYAEDKCQVKKTKKRVDKED